MRCWLANDVVSEITLPDNATAPGAGDPAAGLEMWNDYDEYGQPRQADQPPPAAQPGSGTAGSAPTNASPPPGYTLMGARLHNPTTGLFTTLDPGYQGGDTAYGYPVDPVNMRDLGGKGLGIHCWSHSPGGDAKFRMGNLSGDVTQRCFEACKAAPHSQQGVERPGSSACLPRRAKSTTQD